MYKIYYKNKDAHNPSFKTEEAALDFYIKTISEITGETKDEILNEDWPSPRGVEKCVKVVKIE